MQARLTPNDRLTWDFSYSYSDEETGMRVGVPTGFITATWRAVYYGNQQGNITDPDGVGFYPDNDDRVNFNRPQRVGSEYKYYSTRAVYEFDTMALTAVAGRIESDLFNYGDVDGGSHDFYYEDLLLNRESTSGELRLSVGNEDAGVEHRCVDRQGRGHDGPIYVSRARESAAPAGRNGNDGR